ncbi:BrnT family toxin [Sphingomonas sanguinis]|uniref:BrnT family toxin n=1 Tax=Sphingomonas sanguinis TaxID=33051 RepID=UPI0030162C41
MDIAFDPAKDQANIAKHGLSLADAVAFDLSSAVVLPDDRHDYGETRYRAFGRVEGQARCLVFAIRGSTVRIISYRRAHEKEMRRYGL